MRSKVLGCGEGYIDKNAFHKNKSLISINEIEINEIVLFNKTSYGNKGSFKRYIGCRHKDGSLSPLNLLKKEFDKNPVYENKHIRAKVSSTQFEHRILKDNEHRNISVEPKNGSRHEYLSVILLDSILIYPDSYCSNKYYPQIFLKKCIYAKGKEAELLGKYIHY